MKTKKWFYLSLAAALVMLIATTALYADTVVGLRALAAAPTA